MAAYSYSGAVRHIALCFLILYQAVLGSLMFRFITLIISFFCLLIATQANSQTNWRPYGSGFEDISVGEDFVWGLKSSGAINRMPIDGAFVKDFSKSPWATIPGRLKDISASGFDWVWGVAEGGEIFKCSKPCAGRWSKVTNLTSAGDLPLQVSGNETHIWVLTRGQKIWQNTIDGSGSWKLIPGTLTHITANGANSIWGINSAGAVWECRKPCYGEPAQKWVRVTNLPNMTPKKVYADESRVWIIDRDGNAWRKDNDGDKWLKRDSGVKNIASVKNRAWKTTTDRRVLWASLREVIRSVDKPYIHTCREGRIKANDTCTREVFFHEEWSLTLEAARAKANSLGGSLAATDHLEQAWKNLALDKWVYGRLSDGSFAVPVQKDYPNFKRGVNFNAKGGNQGFFYVKGCQDDRKPFVKGQYCDYGFEKNLASPLSEKDLNMLAKETLWSAIPFVRAE